MADQLKDLKIYHSDIKLENIMMDREHNIYLIDTDSFH